MKRTLLLSLLVCIFASCDDAQVTEEVVSPPGHKIYNFSTCTVYWDFDEACTMELGTFEYQHDTRATCDGTLVEHTYTCEDGIDTFCGVMEHQLVTRTYHLVRSFSAEELDPQCDPPDPALMEAMECALALSPNFYLIKEISYDVCDANGYDCSHGICLSTGRHIIAPFYLPAEPFEDQQQCLDHGAKMGWISCFEGLLERGEYYLSAWGWAP